MAQRRKKKGLAGIVKSKPKTFTAIIISIIVAILVILDSNGLINYDKIKQTLGLTDSPAVNAEMSVHYINVGQGDSTLVISNGEAMLIDAGEKECGKIVADYLKELNISKLKYVIATHPHSDHIGGLGYIVENFEVETIIMPKVPDDMTPTTRTYEKLLTSIKNCGLKIRQAKSEELGLGESKIEIFPPLGDYSNLNDYSVITRVTHGENTFLFTGDTEKKAEESFVMRNKNIQSKIYKLGHHGSSNASTAALLEAVKPKYAVISCGEGNKYGHPHDETLERIDKYCDYVFSTAEDGTIVFESDGKGISVSNSSGNNLL